MHTVGKVANVTPVCHQSVSGSLQGLPGGGAGVGEGAGGRRSPEVILNGSQTGSLTEPTTEPAADACRQIERIPRRSGTHAHDAGSTSVGTLFQVDTTQIQVVAQNAIRPGQTSPAVRETENIIQLQNSRAVTEICPGLWRGRRVGRGGGGSCKTFSFPIKRRGNRSEDIIHSPHTG